MRCRIGHQHVAAEPREQRLFPILVIAWSPARAVAIGSRSGFREYITLSDTAADAADLDRSKLHVLLAKHGSLTHTTLATLLAIKDFSLAASEATIEIDSYAARATFKLGGYD
jgi:hypothetical protein